MMQAGAPQGAVVQNQQVVTVQPGLTTVTAPNQQRPGNWNGMTATGIIQIVAGSLTIILGIADLVMLSIISVIGYHLWSGLLFYVVAGILGVVAGTKKIRGVAIGYMVMSILACLASCVVIGFSSADFSFNLSCLGYSYGYNCIFSSLQGSLAVHVLLLILGIVEFVTSITGASMTCSAVCCTKPTPTVALITCQTLPQMGIAGQPGPQLVCPPQQATGAPRGQPQAYAYQLYPQGQATPQAEPAADFKYHVINN